MERKSPTIDQNRRRFIGMAGGTLAAAQFGLVHSASGQSEPPGGATTKTAALFPGFSAESVKTSGTTIYVLRKGTGRPLLLLHGYPETHLTWHKVAPRLAEQFSVIVPDLRGYGDSSKPPGGERHENYSFRAMAQDQVEVMAALGFSRFAAAGHDRGARVLHRMCLDHPGTVERAAFLDILPQHHLLNHLNLGFAVFSYHWFFMVQPFDFPERLMGADPEYFIRRKLAKTPAGLSFFKPEALAEY